MSTRNRLSGSHQTLPGAELVDRGLADADRGVQTVESLLVAIGAPRLRQLGLKVPPGPSDPEERLYLMLDAKFGDGAHSKYNGLIRRLVSFERAAACVK